jgi:hypothetical protein
MSDIENRWDEFIKVIARELARKGRFLAGLRAMILKDRRGRALCAAGHHVH